MSRDPDQTLWATATIAALIAAAAAILGLTHYLQ